jgi:nitrous oxidase accessory protein
LTHAKAGCPVAANNDDMKAFWLSAFLALPAWAALPLQPLIDATPAGGTLRPAAGLYAGPVVIERPMVIDGGGKVSVDAGNRGTVLTVRASGVTIRGLRLTGSGETHDGIDAGLAIEGHDNLVDGNVLDEVFFGIHIKGGNRNRIRDNRVTGKNLSLGLRGDGLRIWNGRDNEITGNEFRRVRDLTLANSPDNRVANNRLADARYAMHIVFSPRTRVEGNIIERTGTGIVAMYSTDLIVRGNRISHALDGGGAALTFKDSGGALVENNEVVHCAVGLMADAPVNAELTHVIRNNRFAHNITGMSFYGEKGGHRILDNHFDNNLTQVSISAPGVGEANVWRGNHWSDYQGFDRDGDGIGDTPYELWLYADRLWMELPKAKFFANSPSLELLDFLERLAPFSSPNLILRDSLPRLRR